MADNSIKLHRGGAGFQPEGAAAIAMGVQQWSEGAAATFALALESAGWQGTVRISLVLEPLTPEHSRHELEAEGLTVMAAVQRRAARHG